MKVTKVILTILLLVITLTIPRVVKWLLSVVIGILVILEKTLTYLIKLIEEEINQKNHEKISNPKN